MENTYEIQKKFSDLLSAWKRQNTDAPMVDGCSETCVLDLNCYIYMSAVIDGKRWDCNLYVTDFHPFNVE